MEMLISTLASIPACREQDGSSLVIGKRACACAMVGYQVGAGSEPTPTECGEQGVAKGYGLVRVPYI
jgi:hypothetical protein